MKNKLKKAINLLPICILTLSAVSCGQDTSVKHPRSVRLTAPQSRQGGIAKTYPALIKESNETSLGFKTAGEISHVYVKEGDYVKNGQLLASLDGADYKLAVNAMQAQYDQMKDEFARMTKLYQNKGMSANEYEKAKAGLQQLENQLQANKNKLSYTQLYSPTNGYIQAVNYSKAEMVDAGTPVFVILDDSGMKVEFDVPVYESKNIKSGGSFAMSMAGGDFTIPLRFISMTPKADGNQLYTVKLEFEGSPSKDITPGMNTTVKISLPTGEMTTEGYNVPLRAVVNKDGKAGVWVLNQDTTVTLRDVTFSGVDKNGMAIIASGLNGSEQIIDAGVNSLHEGEKVKVIEPSSETNVGGLM
ncbi:MAG: efflux RND transporter periplasmic adaptor subunit [Muribaculaceae bacterium]|nr:efflux RND transporter periplasmic adaptor subunit [Muribaculaceae bacterium]